MDKKIWQNCAVCGALVLTFSFDFLKQVCDECRYQEHLPHREFSERINWSESSLRASIVSGLATIASFASPQTPSGFPLGDEYEK